jgi:hypothetical protein
MLAQRRRGDIELNAVDLAEPDELLTLVGIRYRSRCFSSSPVRTPLRAAQDWGGHGRNTKRMR